MNVKLEDFFSPKPWYSPVAAWEYRRKVLEQIGVKAYARLETIKFHWEGAELQYRDGLVAVKKPHEDEFPLYTDLKRYEDFGLMISNAEMVKNQLPDHWEPVKLLDRETWYRRSGFRLVLPVTCNVYFAPNGEWSRGFLDLGAISAD